MKKIKINTNKIIDVLKKIVKTITIVIPLIQGMSVIWKNQGNNNNQ
jgi:hypothetical protein